MFLKLTAFLLLFELSSAFVQLDLRRHEGKSLEALKLGKSDEFKEFRQLNKQNLEHRFSRGNKFGAVNQTIYDYFDAYYTINVTIGTPPKPFNLLLSTATSVLIVQDIGAKKACTFCYYEHNYYNSTESSTYQFYKNATAWESTSGGYYANEIVRLGDAPNQLNITNAYIGVARNENDYYYAVPFDGMFGMAIKDVGWDKDGVDPVLKTALDKHLLDNSYVTIWLASDGRESRGDQGGAITFGDHDELHCDSNTIIVPLVENGYYEFRINGIETNGNLNRQSLSVMSNTGTFFTIAPSKVIQLLITDTNATYNSNFGLYEVDCDVKFTWSLIIDDEIKIEVDQSTTIFEVPDYNICLLGFEEYDRQGYADIYLGDNFMRQWCQTYNLNGYFLRFNKALH